MALGGTSLEELQREMMADEIREERAQIERALAGKTGARGGAASRSAAASWGGVAPRGGAVPRGIAAPRSAAASQSAAASRSAAGSQGGARESFDPHRLPPYPKTGAPPSDVGPYASGAPAGNYRPGRTLDVHEILKREAFASSAASCDDHFEKSRPCPSTVYGVSDQYLVLDSWEKVESSRINEGQFVFNFMVQGVTRDQNIGVKDKLDTIIGIQVCDFCIPLLPLDDFDPERITSLSPGLSELGLTVNGPPPVTGDAVSNPQSQTPFCERVTMYLKEIGLQSISDAENRRHHFEFDASVVGSAPAPADGDRILLTPLRRCDYYLFTDPIQDIHGLTVCFYNPTNTLAFPPDCLYDTIASADAGQSLQFTYNDPTNLINLAVGDRIYIRGFQAYDAASDTDYSILNAYIGRPEGHQVGVDGFSISPVPPAYPTPTSGTTVAFRLNPDVSTAGLSPPIAANTQITSRTRITVCIAKNRTRIPLRLRRVVDRLTNYIAP